MIAPTGLSPDEAARLIDGRHDDPFAVLGPHLAGGGLITRCLIPEADRVAVLTWSGKAAGSLTRTHEGGLFEGKLRLKKPQKLRYLAGNAGGEWLIGDAYSFRRRVTSAAVRPNGRPSPAP
jgi:1,4-alpha-glucan branching enzyme